MNALHSESAPALATLDVVRMGRTYIARVVASDGITLGIRLARTLPAAIELGRAMVRAGVSA